MENVFFNELQFIKVRYQGETGIPKISFSGSSSNIVPPDCKRVLVSKTVEYFFLSVYQYKREMNIDEIMTKRRVNLTRYLIHEVQSVMVDPMFSFLCFFFCVLCRVSA